MNCLEYEELLTFVHSNFHNARKCIEDLVIIYPGYDKKTFYSIFNQEFQKKMKATHHLHCTTEKSDEYYFKYLELKSKKHKSCVLANLAYEAGLSPYLMARIIVERHLAYTKNNGGRALKSDVNALLKNSKLIMDVALERDVNWCATFDDFYGPVAESIKLSVGHEYEIILKNKLEQHSIPYQDEYYLRSRGYDKTPDTVLQIPIAINGHVVNWIESKALFGDAQTHDRYLREQLNCYINRFGPGLVIYWFGHLSELTGIRENRDVLVMDRFPEEFKTLHVVERMDLMVRTIGNSH